MKLVKFRTDPRGRPRVGLLETNATDDAGDAIVRPLDLDPAHRESGGRALSEILHAESPEAEIRSRLARLGEAAPIPADAVTLLAPIDDQEVWGAGVTYQRSKVARQEESESGGSFYDLVYRADRPELFFKANPRRVAGPGGAIRVRSDTSWCVPEPELALVVSPAGRLVALTLGDDVSARDIEGRNPLYLPQAKVYDECCALGPALTLVSAIPDPRALEIRLVIERDGAAVVDQSTSVGRMVRDFDELIAWLFRDQSFPDGVILLTGTGIVPPDEFSLKAGDLVKISTPAIGTLANTTVQNPVPGPIPRPLGEPD